MFVALDCINFIHHYGNKILCSGIMCMYCLGKMLCSVVFMLVNQIMHQYVLSMGIPYCTVAPLQSPAAPLEHLASAWKAMALINESSFFCA